MQKKTNRVDKMKSHRPAQGIQSGSQNHMQSPPSIYKTFSKNVLLAVLLSGLIGCGGSNNDGKNSNSSMPLSSSSSSLSSSSSSSVISYSLTYTADSGGSISGQTSQSIEAGNSGSSVTAIAAENYRFTGWSDGSLRATRTDSNIQQSTTLTATFASADLWSEAPYSGQMKLEILGARSINVIWDDGEPRTVIVSSRNDLDISTGAAEAQWHTSATSPFKVENLETDQPVYIAIQQDDVVTAWSSTIPRKMAVNGKINTTQLTDDGVLFLGGDFNSIGPGHDFHVLLPTAANGITNPSPLAFPETDGIIVTATSDSNGGWYVGGTFTKVASVERHGFAHISSTGNVLPWNPVEGQIYKLAFHKGVLYIAGSFVKTSPSDVGVSLIAFKSDTETPLFSVHTLTAANQVGHITSIAFSEERIYVNGYFQRINNISRNNLAALTFDGQIADWNPEPTSAVQELAVIGDVVYVRARGNPSGDQLKAFDSDGKPLELETEISGTISQIVSYAGHLYISSTTQIARNEHEFHLHRINKEGKNIPLNEDLKLHSTHGFNVINDILYFYDYEQSRIRAYSLSENVFLPWFIASESSKKQLLASGSTILLLAEKPQLIGGRDQHNMALLLNEELLSWSPPHSAGVTIASTQIGNLFITGGENFHIMDFQGNTIVPDFRIKPAANDQNTAKNPLITSVVSTTERAYLGGNFIIEKDGIELPASSLIALDQQGTLLQWNNSQQYVTGLALNSDSVYATGIAPIPAGMFKGFLSKLSHTDLSNPSIETPLTSMPSFVYTDAEQVYFFMNHYVYSLKNNGESSRKFNISVGGYFTIPPHITSMLSYKNLTYAGGSLTHFEDNDKTEDVGHVGRIGVFDQNGDLIDWDYSAEIRSLKAKNTTLIATGVFLPRANYFPYLDQDPYYETYKLYDLNTPLREQ